MGITKYVLPVVVGAMAGMILITLGKIGVYLKYPPPSGTDFYDADSLAKYMKILPANGFVLFLVDYVICSFAAGVICTLIAKRASVIPAVAVGIALTLSGMYYIFTMPQPMWYSLASMFAFLPFVYLGYLSVRKKQLIKDDESLAKNSAIKIVRSKI
jgi:hypothetical protein